MHSDDPFYDDPLYTSWLEGCVSVPVIRVAPIVSFEALDFLIENIKSLDGLTFAYTQRSELLERAQVFWSRLLELASLDPYCASDYAD